MPCRILDLPPELLAAIALQVDQNRNTDLRNLASACTALRVAAQEALLKPVMLSNNGICKFLEMLVERPDLAKRIHHVDLGDYGFSGGTSEREGTAPNEALHFDIKTFRKYEAAITEEFGPETWKKVFSSRVGDRWGESRSYYLALLSIMAPNLRELTFEMRPLSSPPEILTLMPGTLLLALQDFDAPFPGGVMELLAKKLEIVKIADNAFCKSPFMHNLSFTALSKLKRLSLPLSAIVSKNTSLIHPLAWLPPSIEHLQIRNCSKFASGILLQLSESKKELVRLQYLDLFFKCSLRSAILLVGYDDNGRIKEMWSSMQSLSRSGLAINTFTQPRVPRSPCDENFEQSDLQSELEAATQLTWEEMVLAAMKLVRLSEIVARDENGAPRARTRFEGLLFRRFWGMPLALFTSSTFDPLAWSGVRMFNGARGTGKDDNDKPSKLKNAPKHEDQKVKVVEKKEVCGCAFKIPVEMTKAARTSATFKTNDWLQVEFFKLPEKRKPVPKKQAAVETPRKRKHVSTIDPIDEVVALATTWKIR